MRILNRALAAAVASALLMSGCGSDSGGEPPKPPSPPSQHVASPTHWEDQIIYFIMTDRFNDGDPSNNDQGAGEYGPDSESRYSGGDLKGIEDKIDYIKGLGATAIWITPPVKNQWWDPVNNYGGYHGYWARNLVEVDEHLGTLEDYKRLARKLHGNGLYLVQDVIVNHMANCFYWTDPATEYFPGDLAKSLQNVKIVSGAQPSCGPTQAPFDQWDPRNPAHVAANIYHWTPKITDYNDPEQEQNYQMSDLDDLNTDNPAVVKALKDSYAFWIREVGVDAFRLDTAFYVKPGFYDEFMNSKDAASPGMLEAAKRAGLNNFYAFGEGFAMDQPFDDRQARKIETYMDDPSGKPILPGMINFPMHGTMLNVFAKGQPTAELGYRLRSLMTLHARPHLMPNFLDNHDVDRYLAGGSERSLRQALMFMMTAPGIPVIYYGTEQGFTVRREAMFAKGYRSGGKDRFDTSAPLYTYLADITKLRRENPVLSRGKPTVLKENAGSDGAFAYRMDYQDQTMLMVFNTSESAVLMDNVDTGLPEGAELQLVKSLNDGGKDAVVGRHGKLTLPLPARSGLVYKVTGKRLPVPGAGISLTLDPLSTEVKTGDFAIGGTASGVSQLKVVIDGMVDDAQTVTVGSNGAWSATVSILGMVDANATHTVVAYDESTGQLSNQGSFKVQPSWTLLKSYDDPAQDDVGPAGTYRYPTDSSWGANRQGDIRKVTLYGSGPVLKIGVTTNKITKTWNPGNGFDHVAFTLFVDVPGKTGLSLMPFQNAAVPAGMAWDLKVRAHGWSNALFDTQGASATRDGAALIPAARLEVDEAANTVYFILSRRALGTTADLNGVKVYVTTWDYDDGYRGLMPGSEQWRFWGGDGSKDPLVLDDTPVLALP